MALVISTNDVQQAYKASESGADASLQRLTSSFKANAGAAGQASSATGNGAGAASDGAAAAGGTSNSMPQNSIESGRGGIVNGSSSGLKINTGGTSSTLDRLGIGSGNGKSSGGLNLIPGAATSDGAAGGNAAGTAGAAGQSASGTAEGTTSANTTDPAPTIRADASVRSSDSIAQEVAGLNSKQILTQTGTSTLHQANETPQQIMALIGR